ncbi:DUF262 domain-containing protein [Micrococcus luteus]|nr:DUF262 domain-containing protein [Micrococcus luteus]
MQTEKHAPEALTIEEVFTAARHYRVPVYQRAYAWTQVEIATLLEDVRRARLRSEKPDTQGASSDYYLGSLVVNRPFAVKRGGVVGQGARALVG